MYLTSSEEMAYSVVGKCYSCPIRQKITLGISQHERISKRKGGLKVKDAKLVLVLEWCMSLGLCVMSASKTCKRHQKYRSFRVFSHFFRMAQLFF